MSKQIRSRSETRCSIGPDLGPNCLQRLSADDKMLSADDTQKAKDIGYIVDIVFKMTCFLVIIGIASKKQFQGTPIF